MLTVHEIGRAGQPDATTVTLHENHQEATLALYGRFHPSNIAGGADSGTAGVWNGKVFQASHTWEIRTIGKEKK